MQIHPRVERFILPHSLRHRSFRLLREKRREIREKQEHDEKSTGYEKKVSRQTAETPQPFLRYPVQALMKPYLLTLTNTGPSPRIAEMSNGQPVIQRSLTMNEVWELYCHDLEEIESKIRHNLHSEAPLINEIAAHIFDGGGKRIRPLLLILCARLTGYDPKNDLVLGSLIEFIHTATLLHDDVLDEAALRRGQPTARRIWGNRASILVGDYLYSRAMQHIAAFKNHDLNDTIAVACRKMAEGEILQLCANRQPLLSESDYLRIVKYKTGALVATACKVGGMLGGVSPIQREALYQFGLSLGIAFQLTDDWLDYMANDKSMGKSLGQDLKQGMVTLPLIHLLQCLPTKDRQILASKIGNESVEEDDLLQIVAHMYQHGSLQYTKARSQEYIDAALLNLTAFEDSTAKYALIVVADYMVNRDH